MSRKQSHSPSARAFLAGVLIAGLWNASASAQQYGQWSWTGRFGALTEGRSLLDNAIEVESRDRLDLFTALDLHGYVVHPLLAEFEVGVDVGVSQASGDSLGDTSNFGYRARLRALPRSKYPFELFVARATSSYADIDAEDPLSLRRLPDTADTWGGRVRVQRGILTGLLFSHSSTTVSFGGPGSPKDDQADRSLLHWSRAGKRLKHAVSVERVANSYGDLDYGTSDLITTWDESGPVWRDWMWNLAVSGIVREYELGGFGGSSSRVQAANSLWREFQRGRRLVLGYSGGLVTNGADSQTHSVSSSMEVPLEGGWRFVPAVSLNVLRSGGTDQVAPTAGVSADWSRTLGTARLGLFGSASYFNRSITKTGEDGKSSTDESGYGGSVGLSLSHTGRMSVTKGMYVELSRNEFTSAGEGVDGLPDLGASVFKGGFEDRASVRVNADRTWNRHHLGGWVSYSVRQQSRDSADSAKDASVEDLQVTVQWRNGWFSMAFNYGTSQVDDDGESQHRTRMVASGGARVASWLSINAAYSHSDQQLDLAPDVVLDTLDLGVGINLGLITLSISAYERTQETLGLQESTTRGYRASIGRTFGGWLPVVSAPKRRGTIR